MANYLFDGLLDGRETDATTLLRIPGAADWSYADTVAASGRRADRRTGNLPFTTPVPVFFEVR